MKAITAMVSAAAVYCTTAPGRRKLPANWNRQYGTSIRRAISTLTAVSFVTMVGSSLATTEMPPMMPKASAAQPAPLIR